MLATHSIYNQVFNYLYTHMNINLLYIFDRISSRKMTTSALRIRILFWFVLFVFGTVTGQSEHTTFALAEERRTELMELAKGLFNPVHDLSFSIIGNDLKSSFEDMPDALIFDNDLKKELRRALNQDKKNPIANYKMANYYLNINNPLLAKSYYQKSYENLDIKFFDGDSAAYYSRRGELKNKLGDPNALDDIKKAISINPNDSLSMLIYPLLLINSKEFNEARIVLSDALNSGRGNVSFPYTLLISNEILKFNNDVMILKNKKENFYQKYRDKNYDELFDYTLIDRFANLHQGDQEIENARLLGDIFGLFFKMILFEPSENPRINFEFTPYELNKIEELILELNASAKNRTINDYTLNRCLGYLFFMKEDWTTSRIHFEKAIEVFPDRKKDKDFNRADCYDAISSMYYQSSDTLNFRKTIEKKIENEKNEENSVDDLMRLAFLDFQMGEIKNADNICKRVLLKNSNQFDALRLKSHLNFLDGSVHMSQFYLQNAMSNMRDETDDYNLGMQNCIYQLYLGETVQAKSNIRIIKEAMGENNCPLCDTLMEYSVP